MDPIDFHKTAEFLKDQNEQCHLRTSINRSYYGLFLYLRDFFKNKGVQFPSRKWKSHHQFVLECLYESRFFQDSSGKDKKISNKKGKSKDSIILGIHSLLKTLLQWRTDADYKLHLMFRPTDSNDCLEKAIKTITNFEKLKNSEREKYIISIANQHAISIVSQHKN
jgi:hypothetical protein